MIDSEKRDTAPGRRRRRNRVGYLPLARRLGIYIVSFGVWLSGGMWLIYHYFIKAQDQFGFENASPLEHTWIVAHGGFSFLSIWVFGMLWLTHIKVGWNAKMNRLTGGTLFSFATWLILSGYGLYYIGNAGVRQWVSLAHWIAGLAGLAIFLVHIFPRISRMFDKS